MTKTTYQHLEDGQLFTRTSARDYNFIVIREQILAGVSFGMKASWHATLKSAERSAKADCAIQEFPVNRTTGERYTEGQYWGLRAKGVCLRMETVGYSEHIVAPINGGVGV